MADCTYDLSGGLGGGTDNVGRDNDDECAKDAASTCVWERESLVHVGRDLWYDDVGGYVNSVNAKDQWSFSGSNLYRHVLLSS